MLSEVTKARIWMWWPYLVGLLICAASVGAVFYFFSKGGESVELDPQANLRELSKVANFRAAYIGANGGEQKLAALQGILSTGTFESGGKSIPFRTIKRRPDKSITTLKMPDYDLSFIVNGERIWQRVEQPNAEPADSLKKGAEAEAMRQLGYFFDSLMHAVLNEPESIVSIIPNIWKGKSCLLVQLELPERRVKARVYVDPFKMTPIARIDDYSGGQKREVFYEDYRPVNEGMLEPFKVETYLNGELQNRVLLEKCIANPGIVSNIFEYTGEAPLERIRTESSNAIP